MITEMYGFYFTIQLKLFMNINLITNVWLKTYIDNFISILKFKLDTQLLDKC